VDPKDRNEYRKRKLKELYDYYFENNQEWKDVIKEIREDSEAKAAYDYLEQKGLIFYKEERASGEIVFAEAKINAQGIDVIEQDLDIR
jgi:hypothetical protein